LNASSAHLKLELAMSGLRLEQGLEAAELAAAGTEPGGDNLVELLLPGDLVASCQVDNGGDGGSKHRLTVENDRFLLRTGDDSTPVPVSVVGRPEFYAKTTSAGTKMNRLGLLHGDFLAIDPAGSCSFAGESKPCVLCPARRNRGATRRKPWPLEEVLEVIRAAFDEGAVEFIYFHTGHYHDDDGGFALLEPYVKAVKQHFDTLVAIQVSPPSDAGWVDRAYAAGVDAVNYPLFTFDEKSLGRACSDRCTQVTRGNTLAALERAARVFPRGTVWSDLVVGMEEPASTIEGIDLLVSLGVLPVLSLHRPSDLASLAAHPLTDPEDVVPIYAHLYKAAREAKLNLQWLRDLGQAVTPLEARFFAGDDAKLDVAVSSFYRSRLGGRAARSLSRFRRRLRVKQVSDSFDSSQL
jgi:hypothetical protein